MAIVTNVDLKLKVDISQTIKYQIITYCFFNDIYINHSDLNLLGELAHNGKVELSKFCQLITIKNIFKSEQSARNAINKAEKKKLLIKDGTNKKVIYINKDMNVQSQGLVLLNIKVLGSETKEI